MGPVSLATGKLHAVLGDVEAARADLALAERQCREGGGAPDLLRVRFALLLLEPAGAERSAALERLAMEADAFNMTAVSTSARDAATA